MKNVLWILLGMFLMYIILKIMSSGTVNGSQITTRFKALAFTSEAANLVKTNEFRELIKTSEFMALVKVLAEEEIKTISQSLVGATVKK